MMDGDDFSRRSFLAALASTATVPSQLAGPLPATSIEEERPDEAMGKEEAIDFDEDVFEVINQDFLDAVGFTDIDYDDWHFELTFNEP